MMENRSKIWAFDITNRNTKQDGTSSLYDITVTNRNLERYKVM